MGAHQSVGSVTGAMTPCSCNRSSSTFSLSRKAYGIVRGVRTQNGWASSVSAMWNFPPSIIFMCPSKTDGNSHLISMAGTGRLALMTPRDGVVTCDGIGVVLRKDGQSLPGQQCPSDGGIDVEVVSVCQCTKGV